MTEPKTRRGDLLTRDMAEHAMRSAAALVEAGVASMDELERVFSVIQAAREKFMEGAQWTRIRPKGPGWFWGWRDGYYNPKPAGGVVQPVEIVGEDCVQCDAGEMPILWWPVPITEPPPSIPDLWPIPLPPSARP